MMTNIHDERGTVLEKTLQEIGKRFGKGAVMKLGESTHIRVETISSGSLALDLALGVGGLPKGRIIEIFRL